MYWCSSGGSGCTGGSGGGGSCDLHGDNDGCGADDCNSCGDVMMMIVLRNVVIVAVMIVVMIVVMMMIVVMTGDNLGYFSSLLLYYRYSEFLFYFLYNDRCIHYHK